MKHLTKRRFDVTGSMKTEKLCSEDPVPPRSTYSGNSEKSTGKELCGYRRNLTPPFICFINTAGLTFFYLSMAIKSGHEYYAGL